MGTLKMQGIVLSSFNYADNDKIVTIFSDKYGKLSLLSLGANKLKSKNKYSLLTFSLSEFEIFKSRSSDSLSKLKTGVLLFDSLKISQSYDNYLYASGCCSLVEQGMEPGQKNFKLFKNLNYLLNNLNQNQNSFRSFVYFLFSSLKFFGGFWQLDRCVKCQQKMAVYRLFSFQDFGLICFNCDEKNELEQTQEWIRFLQTLNQKSFSEINQDFVPINYLIVLGRLLINYYQEVLGLSNLSLIKILNKPFFQEKNWINYTDSVLTR